ncbi:MAG: MBL fold metallo-hydrolase [Woeseiaceae bacterium]
MPPKIIIAWILILNAPLAVAGNLTEKNQDKTDKIVSKLVASYGGEESLDALDSIAVKHSTEFVAVEQSRRPAPPWDTSTADGMTAIDLSDKQLAVINQGRGNGFEFHNATLINDAESYELDYRAGLARPIAEPDFAGNAGPFIRVTPVLLVKQLRDNARTAHFLGATTYDDREHYVVRFAMASGPAISLYVDKKTHLISHSERLLPGYGLVEYDFKDYEVIDGIPFNRTFVLHTAGDVSMERKVLSVAINKPIEKLLTVDSRLQRTEALPPDPMSRNEIAEGVHLIGGRGTYGLFIEMEDHVIAVGGVGGLEERLEEMQQVTNKPVRYGVLTHHHSDHVAAVAGYAELGATIVTPTAHVEVVDAAAGDFEAKIKQVDGKLKLSDASRKVMVIDIGPTPHTEHLLVTWLPDERILFEADHFSMPRSGPVPPAIESTRKFAEALERLGLNPALIVSAHSPRPGTMGDLAASLDTPAADSTMVGATRR